MAKIQFNVTAIDQQGPARRIVRLQALEKQPPQNIQLKAEAVVALVLPWPPEEELLNKLGTAVTITIE